MKGFLPNNKIVEAVQDILKTYGYVAYLWHVDDVHFICEQNAIPKMTDDEALEIFTIASEQFDGENGISWPQLEKAVFVYIHRKKILSMMCDITAMSKSDA